MPGVAGQQQLVGASFVGAGREAPASFAHHRFLEFGRRTAEFEEAHGVHQIADGKRSDSWWSRACRWCRRLENILSAGRRSSGR